MKRDLFIAMFLAAFFHVAVLFGEKLLKHKEQTVATTTVEDVLLVSDTPKEEEEPQKVELKEGDEEVLPEEFMAASLGEPPPSAVTLGALTMAVRPDKPRPPRPNNERFTVPTSGQKGTVGTSAQTITNIFDASQLDQQPQMRYAPSPRYPFNLTRAGVEGTVVVTFLVNQKGRVMSDTITFESCPHKDFEAPVIEALRQTQFAPGLVKGQPVIFKFRRPFVFSLSNQR